MDPPEKCRKLGEKSEEIMNHFTRLPQCIIHHILSFLEAKEIVVTSLLSKAWYQWFSLFPYVECDWSYDRGLGMPDEDEVDDHEDEDEGEDEDDDHEDEEEDEEEDLQDDQYVVGLLNNNKNYSCDGLFKLQYPEVQQKKIDFLNLVESSVKSRLHGLLDTGTHIRRFRFKLVLDDLDLVVPCVEHLVALALQGNVEELDLNIKTSLFDVLWIYPRYRVPQAVFLHEKLTALNLSGCKFELEGDHNQPKFPHLKTLYISWALFVGLRAENMFENLAASFPCIEYLEMCTCHGLKRIRSASSLPQLKHVAFKEFYGLKMVDLLAPKLLTFEFHPPGTYPVDNLCEVNLPCSLLLNKLNLSQVQIGASLHKLFADLSGVLEVLRLHLCNSLQDPSGSISVRYLKELLLVDCNNLSIDEINNPLPEDSVIRLEKVHIVFPRRSNVPWSGWKDFLMRLNIVEDLKLVIYKRKNAFIHENLDKVSASSLSDLQNLNYRICISSIPCFNVVNILAYRTSINNLYVVCLQSDLRDKLFNCGGYTYRTSFFRGAKLITRDEVSPPALKSFLQECSSGEYNSTTFKLKLERKHTRDDRYWLNHMFNNFDSF